MSVPTFQLGNTTAHNENTASRRSHEVSTGHCTTKAVVRPGSKHRNCNATRHATKIYISSNAWTAAGDRSYCYVSSPVSVTAITEPIMSFRHTQHAERTEEQLQPHCLPSRACSCNNMCAAIARRSEARAN